MAQFHYNDASRPKLQMNFPPHRFSARLAALTEALAHVASICKQAGLKHSEQLRVELVVEELFTNTVQHGYGEDCDQPVWIGANFSNDGLCITYEDAAPAYKPLDQITERPSPTIGGLGLTLIEKFAHTRYLHENGRNTIILTFSPTPD